MTFNLPSTLRDINLSQWTQFIDIYEKNKDAENTEFLEKKMLQIFCGTALNDISKLGLDTFDRAIQHLNILLRQEPSLVSRFKLIGTDGVEVEFGLIPNFDKMSYGEFIDLEKYIYENDNIHRAMAVLYRPIKHSSNEKYLIHDYQGTEYLADVMKFTPLDAFLSVKVFFYRLAKKLANYTMVYTLKELQETQLNKKDELSVKNGEVINQYIHSLEKMSAELERLQR